MRRLIVAGTVALCVFGAQSTSALARHHRYHHHYHHHYLAQHHRNRHQVAVLDANGSVVRSRNGHAAHVAPSARGKLQCVVDHLEALGVRITALGGYRPGHCSSRHMHSCSLALDVNQYARDRGGPPRSASNAAAEACGVVSGSWWRNADNGHFQVGGYAGNHGHSSRIVVARRYRHHSYRVFSARRHYYRHRHYAVAATVDRLTAH